MLRFLVLLQCVSLVCAVRAETRAVRLAASAAPQEELVVAKGIFVAVGYGGFRGWSLDGEHWSAQRWSEKNQDDDNIIFSVTYRDGIFLCAGGGAGRGFILRSVDGKQWTETVKTRWRITGVLTLSDRFFSVFDDHFQSSADGVEWRAQAEAHPKASDGIGGGFYRRWTPGNGAIVFAGDYDLGGGNARVGWIGGTRNGESPMTCEKQSADVCGLAFGNGCFVACTRDGNLLRSTDGQHFATTGNSGDTHEDDGVLLHEGAFYLRGRKGVQTSRDGIHWTVAEHPPHIPRAVSPEGVALDYGWGGIQVAVDGKNWHKATTPIDATGICAVAYGVPKASNSKAEVGSAARQP
jgi:hypothetical protein